MKVYCKKCLHYKSNITTFLSSSKDICIHNNNTKLQDTYKERTIKGYKNKPAKINRNNDCKFFQTR